MHIGLLKRLAAIAVAIAMMGAVAARHAATAQSRTDAAAPAVGAAVRPVPPGTRLADDPGKKGDTYYWFERQTVRSTLKVGETVVVAERRGDGKLHAKITDASGNDRGDFTASSTVLQYRSAAGDGIEAQNLQAQNDNADRLTLHWVAAQAFTLARDGTTFPASVTDTPIQDESGNLTGIVGVSADITERRRAEEALREAEKRSLREYEMLLQRLAFNPGKGVEVIMRRLLDDSATGIKPETRGKACMALAGMLKQRADELPDAEAKEAEKLNKESEELLERVVEKFADVKGNRGGTLAEEAKQQLFELRFLSKGKPAPDIEAEDLDGKEFKLSDYKGKVVLIDFWGNW